MPPFGTRTTAGVDADQFLQPELLDISRMPMRATRVAHPSADAARRDATSPWRRSLDGSWKFLLVDRPGDAPAGWQTGSTRRWSSVAVPGVWTRQGTGDRPHYTNVQMPWPDLEPPQVPDPNPTGLYRTDVELPAGWRRHAVALQLGGVESVAAVWCNGTFVGMGKDSRLPQEFDLTPALVPGVNTLAVMVVRYSDAPGSRTRTTGGTEASTARSTWWLARPTDSTTSTSTPTTTRPPGRIAGVPGLGPRLGRGRQGDRRDARGTPPRAGGDRRGRSGHGFPM